MRVSNRNLLFQGSSFRGYVSFREGRCPPHLEISQRGSIPIASTQLLFSSFLQLQLGRGMDSSLAAKLAHSQAHVGEVESEEFTDIVLKKGP